MCVCPCLLQVLLTQTPGVNAFSSMERMQGLPALRTLLLTFEHLLLCCLLQVFLTHTPGVNTFFSMEPMHGLQWLRVFVCMAVVYFIVEMEKVLVDPLLMPIIKPVLRWCERHTPQFLSVDQPLSARLARICGSKHLARMDSQYKFQARGKYKRCRGAGKDKAKQDSDGGREENEVVPEIELGGSGRGGAQLGKQLSMVVERAHSEHGAQRSSQH